jgi:hypothetical protein
MTAQSLFKEIESNQLAAELNVASEIGGFVHLVESHPLYEEAMTLSRNDGEFTGAVVGRLSEIASRACDPQYLHPADTPVAVYLLILRKAAPGFSRLAVGYIPNDDSFWWARKLAALLLDTPISSHSNTVAVSLGGVSGLFTSSSRAIAASPASSRLVLVYPIQGSHLVDGGSRLDANPATRNSEVPIKFDHSFDNTAAGALTWQS